jgi:hypothetical protein
LSKAGLGKTRLIAEALAIAKDKGLSVGSGIVADSDQAVPMGPLVAAVLPLVDPATRSALPYLREQRYWLLEELEDVLESLAMRSPLLLCIDDGQWGDSAFLTALRVLPVRLATFPIVWLVAYRSPQAPPQLRAVIESLEQIGAGRLRLRPLGDAAVAEITTDVLGAEPGDVLLEMAQRSHGSPFLLVELLHGWQRTAWSTSAQARQSWSRCASLHESAKACKKDSARCPACHSPLGSHHPSAYSGFDGIRTM